MNPRLRPFLDLQPLAMDGERFLLLRDQTGVAANPIVLPLALVPLVSQFDGSHSLDELQDAWEEFGVTEDFLATLIEELDRGFFLESPRFEEERIRLEGEFRATPVRSMSHVGVSYPEATADVDQLIARYQQEAGIAATLPDPGDDVLALISPHIDYQRGWKTYAKGYQALARIAVPDIVFLIGTTHQPAEGIFHLTKKAFRTPFGDLPAADEVIDDLAQRFGPERSYREEFLHKSEHSLELQLPFLGARFRGALPRIVPILVGSFYQYLHFEREPADSGEARDFIDALTAVVRNARSAGKRILFYGGVDLSHVGMFFGDAEPVAPKGLDRLRVRDRALLDAALACDARRLFQQVAEDRDAQRVCGFPSIYTMLAVLRNLGVSSIGKLVDYDQAVNRENDCIVSFASAFWSGKSDCALG